MKAINIEDLRDFTKELFSGSLFDAYLLKELEIVTYNTFYINGKVNFHKEESEMEEYSFWKSMKGFAFDIIKGKYLPISFKLILKLNSKELKKLILENNLVDYQDKLLECFLNIRYENQKLTLTTGLFINEFTLDKSPDLVWDSKVLELLNSKNIKFIGV